MSKNNHTQNGIARLHYASARSGKRRALHTNEECADLQQASKTNSAPITNLPRGKLCSRCEPDTTLADLRDDESMGDASGLPTQCDACGYASTSDGTAFWSRTPQGRPTCPECGVIPEGHTLESRQEVPADD
jgi:hypothetical protein